MIIPAESSQLGIGKEIIVPALLHPLILTDSRTLTIVGNILTLFHDSR
jgi:hypothetical protein